jgi:RNA polymerase subunit RPABC4/transcription elongation factor Spt4
MSKLKVCKVCHKEVAKSAKTCPNCGAKLKMGLFTKLIIGIGVLIIIGAIASAGNKGNDKTSTASMGAPNPTSAPTAQEPAQLSKEGVSSDVKIAVLGFESKDTLGDNQFSKAKAQGVFKVLKISITNNQKDAITVDTNSFKLIDGQKREFTSSSEALMALSTSSDKKESFFLKQINPGITIEGYIAYDVPRDAKDFTLKARGGMMGKEITLKVE